MFNHTHTYQLQHVFIFWHNGELQHTLTAGHIRGKGGGEDRKYKEKEVKNKLGKEKKGFFY